MDELKIIIELQHNCRALFSETRHVVERHDGKVVWEGDVSIYDIDHKDATTAYAWSDPMSGSEKRRYFAVLGVAPINTANQAVQAVLIQRYRELT